MQHDLNRAKDAIIKVGDGRGFLIDSAPWPHCVITAAHCLPHLPPAHAFSHTEERTYANLLGPIGAVPTLWTECLFVDPVADLAVLAAPDNQALYDECEAYEQFMEDRPTLSIGTIKDSCAAWLLTARGDWQQCTVAPRARWLTLIDPKDGDFPGCSGSPILTTDGGAVGIVVVSGGRDNVHAREQPGQPMLASGLPVWLMAKMCSREAIEKGGA